MTPKQKSSFLENGWLYIPGALAKRVVHPVKAHVQNELKRQNIWSTGRTLSRKFKDIPVFQQTGKLGQLINYPKLNEKLISEELYSDMCQLAGTSLSGQEGKLLISLPHQVDWSLEGLSWHRDISKSQLSGIPGVQAFVLLDNLSVKGGATLALAGSHRIKSQSQAKQIISRLTGDGFDGRVNVDGIELSLIEMAGRAGDVYLMDMRLLHTPSINSTKNVRMMATARYFAV
ncbi:phytanoyl-CoA dioxygenase family protein [Gilvimarinus sp. F26214L]|uniref:phytanoyl-CoA dioxygenase family protein n=1 Tax=Gilvimarinus sp. DZF01 TaxID=3461371 RepID=UPI0040460791